MMRHLVDSLLMAGVPLLLLVLFLAWYAPELRVFVDFPFPPIP